MQRNIDNQTDHLNWRAVSNVFIVFGMLGLLTSCLFTGGPAQTLASKQFSPIDLQSSANPPRVGPLRIDNKGDAVEVTISTNLLQSQSWAYIQGEVQDASGEYLFSFGDELWYETGRDSDGAWTDHKRKYEIDITFPDAGIYYLQFSSESGSTRPSTAQNNPLNRFSVLVRSKIGSTIPHLIYGIIVLLIGLGVQYISRRQEIHDYIKSHNLQETGLAYSTHQSNTPFARRSNVNMRVKRRDITLNGERNE